MIVGIHHVQITIPPGTEDVARRFYCDLLGLTEIAKPASLQGRGGFWLQIADRQVHVGVEDGVERTRTKAHIAFEVRGLPDWRQRMAEGGFPPLENAPIPGFDRFEFRDPFGNRLEMIEAV